MIRRLIAPSAGALLALGVPAALGQSGGTPSGTPGQPPTRAGNPCLAAGTRAELLCPDLVMWRPYDLYFVRVGRRVRLRAGNSIVNQGRGPLRVRGTRDGLRSMAVKQQILGADGVLRSFPSPARLVFKPIPGYGTYWKFRNAARFELWSTGSGGRLVRRVRIGPKLVYCLRDLRKRFSSLRSPTHRRFPACSEDPNAPSRTLGTSVGWSDDYPASYPEQWVDVTGLRGRFAFFQVADPLDHLYESNERNNRSPIVYRTLPPRG